MTAATECLAHGLTPVSFARQVFRETGAPFSFILFRKSFSNFQYFLKGGRIMTLVTNGRLITRDPEGQGYYEHGAVAYEGTKIVEIGEEAAL